MPYPVLSCPLLFYTHATPNISTRSPCTSHCHPHLQTATTTFEEPAPKPAEDMTDPEAVGAANEKQGGLAGPQEHCRDHDKGYDKRTEHENEHREGKTGDTVSSVPFVLVVGFVVVVVIRFVHVEKWEICGIHRKCQRTICRWTTASY